MTQPTAPFALTPFKPRVVMPILAIQFLGETLEVSRDHVVPVVHDILQ